VILALLLPSVKLDAINSMEPKMASRTYPSYYVYRDNRGEYRWTYEASNGKTIAVSSEGYVAKSDCVNGINLMNASYANPVFDSTSAYA
jgi:uncharacterized protein YegP (UPF0339 family)